MTLSHNRGFRLTVMENQASHLDTLPRFLIFLVGVLKRRVRHSSRNRRIRVEALDEENLGRGKIALEVPPMRRVRPQRPCLALMRGVLQGCADEIRLGDRVRVRHGDGILSDGRDGTPYLVPC